MSATTVLPTEQEVLAYSTTLSNWGRWGESDERGTLNLITDEVRRAAISLARTGRAVSLAWDIGAEPPGPDEKVPLQRYMLRHGQGALEGEHPERQIACAEYIGLVFHGRRVTHLDAPSHIVFDGKIYNGRPGWHVSSQHGAAKSSVLAARDGIVTRGILVDAPRYRGVPWLEPGEPVQRDELEAILRAERVGARAGDALILRTGYGRSRIENGPKWEGKQAGWGASCLPFFRERDVAIIACDTSGETHPSGYAFRGPIHGIGIAAMGMWLIDNCQLERVAAACAELERWEFALTIGPIPVTGATGSQVNPIAIL